MPPKGSKGKKPAPTASEKESSKPAKNPDKGKAKNESTQQVQNDESEKDKEIKALQLRVDCLEKNMNLKVFQTPSGFSIAEEDQLAYWQGAFKSAEKELIMLKKGLPSSGNGNVPGTTDESRQLTEKIATLEKEISTKDIAIAGIKTELDKANSALDEMRKQLSDNRTELNNLNTIITKKDKIVKVLEGDNNRLKRDIPNVLSKRHSQESPRNTSAKSQPSDGNTPAKLAALETPIQSKDYEIKILKETITQLESAAKRHSKESEINDLKEKITQLESAAISDKQSNAKLQEEMREKDESLEQLKRELKSIRKELEEKGSEIQRVKEDNESQLQRMREKNDAELQRMKEQKDNEERSKQKWMDKVKEPETNTERSKSAKARSEPLQTLLEEKEAEIQTKTSEIESLKREMDGLKNSVSIDTKTLQKQLDKSAKNIARLEADLEAANKVSIDTKKLQEQLEQNKREIHRLASELGVAKSELSELKTKRESQNKEIDALKKEIEDLKKTNSLRREKTMDKTASPGRDDVGVLKQQLSKANQEIEELKSRLSKMVGENLTNNNPNITDLSDENRPTKLAEMYSEIYDNEWTDAFEELVKHEENETDVIAELLRILQNTAKFCGNVADRYIESLQKSASRLQDKSSTKNQFKKLHLLKELRKSYAPSLAEEVYSLYVEENGKPQKAEAYTKSCIRLCWLMSVQDPRVVLDEVKTPTPFDADRYKTYTKSGKQMAYVVWPTMLLNEGGPILIKGVAQGK